ncbi:MAG: DUF423 domain-containing protein [Gammaproteobacteria bacterium]|nr:DUF423 domain-containing protein [Gammaproteobacteria bacterium]
MNLASICATAGAFFGLTAVILGALGAHGLAARGLEAAQISSWQTAVQYQMYHALALLLVSVWLRVATPSGISVVVAAWFLGALLFSGSIYLLALGGPRWLGPVTPIGGVFLIIGWGSLLVAAYRS